jgi:hypothetical protein
VTATFFCPSHGLHGRLETNESLVPITLWVTASCVQTAQEVLYPLLEVSSLASPRRPS